MTYGEASLSFLAMGTVQELAHVETDNFPVASKIALRDFYIDDLISGTDTPKAALIAVQELNDLMRSGGFNLRKWSSNCPQILESLSCTQHSDTKFFVLQENESSALGIQWSTSEDIFHFTIKLPESIPNPTTKHNLLFESSHLFDPLGLLVPCIVTTKVLLQSLWLAGVSWEDTLPNDIQSKWQEIKSELYKFQFEIPRLVCLQTCNYHIHIFCDASQLAYAACIYVVSTSVC